jgi:hypothetical protein
MPKFLVKATRTETRTNEIVVEAPSREALNGWLAGVSDQRPLRNSDLFSPGWGSVSAGLDVKQEMHFDVFDAEATDKTDLKVG